MKLNKSQDDIDLCFSKIYGNGIYELTQETVQSPLISKMELGKYSPKVRNVITGEVFFMKKFYYSLGRVSQYEKRILSPVEKDCILWPADMVNLSEEQEICCTLLVEHKYTEEIPSTRLKFESNALLFPYGSYPKTTNLEEILQSIPIGENNWKNPLIKNIVIGIVKTFNQINRYGYIYQDIHLSRLYFRENKSLFLDFSNLICTKDEVEDEDNVLCRPEKGDYPIEFAESAYVMKFSDKLDFDSQNYSLCALLFYLMFGRYAYDGTLMSEFVDSSAQNHDVKFTAYHKNNTFIFDPDDRKNKIGGFSEEDRIVNLWNECPDEIKQMFITTLKKNNADRKYEVHNPTPYEWLECLKKVGWYKSV